MGGIKILKLINKFFKKEEEQSLNEFLNVKNIKENILYTLAGQVIQFIKVEPINIELLTDEELESKMNFSSIEFSEEQQPYKILVIPRAVDISEHIEEQEELKRILSDLYDYLIKKNERENKAEYTKLIFLLRPISVGQASTIWNGYTDLKIDSRITAFNTKNMQEFQAPYKRAQYYNIMSYAWEILNRNKEEKDILIADECHILIDPNITQTLEYLRNISKRARKYNSSIVVITQSIEDFLNEKIKLYGQSLLANSTYKLFFKSDGQDLRDVVKTFGLSKKEESLIYNAQKGNCLISAGTRKIYATIRIPNKERKVIDENYDSSMKK